jgi:acyl-CoA thioesterase-2
VNARTFLGIERTGEETWSFDVTERVVTPGNFLFGGAGLASALVALEEASARPTIWATAQYLSYAPLGSTVTVKTDLAVVGAHVTQARATTYAEDCEILTVNGAFGIGELTAPTPWVTMPLVKPPEECRAHVMPEHLDRSIFNHLETRIAMGRLFEQIDDEPGSPVSALWTRVPGHFDISAATLAIFGDYVAGGLGQPLGFPVMGRSLDNTIRIARLEPTEWVLTEIHMHALSGGFAQGTAFMWSQSGSLLGTASQSIAARRWDPTAP